MPPAGRRQATRPDSEGVGGGSRTGRPGAAPLGRARAPHRRPGGSRPPRRRGAPRARARPTGPRRTPGGETPAPGIAPGTRRRATRTPRPACVGWGDGVRGEKGRPGPPDLPRARPPPTRGGRATPLGVFKPPRRDALGTWRRRSEARARAGRAPWGWGRVPRGPRLDAGPRQGGTPSLPARDGGGFPPPAPPHPDERVGGGGGA